MFLKNRVLILTYGVGGHKEQMMRVMNGLLPQNTSSELTIVAFTDDTQTPKWIDKVFLIDEIRSKTSKVKFFNFFSFFKLLINFFKLRKEFGKLAVLSTGPGHCIIVSALVKLFGGKVVHIETWSRFYTKSLTGKIMYFLSDRFYVQNEELLLLYPHAIYSGRL